MPNIEGQKKWSDVRLLEAHEFARGGANGNLNEQSKALVDRTEFLKEIQKQKQASVLDYGAVPSLSVASDAAFAAAISDLSDGDLLTIDGDFYLENDWLINKAINLDFRGHIYLNGNANNAVRFIQEPSYILTPAPLLALPKAGDSLLLITPPDGINLSDYCFTLESTEVLTPRLGFANPYYKNEYGSFISADGHLTTPICIDYTDISKLTLRLYKKQRARTINNLVPRIKSGTFSGTTRAALVQEMGVNNLTYNNCGPDKTNAESWGEGWSINRSGLNTYNNPVTIKTNKPGSDAYPFIGFIHGLNTFNSPKTILAKNAHRGRFFASRHGSDITFNGLFGSIDEHWGYRYALNDSTIYSGGVITFAGGDLKLNNVNRYAKDSQDGLVTLRSDTPTAHGDLIFENCNIEGPAFYANRSSSDLNVSVLRKSFDRIIFRGVKNKDFGYQAISLRGYNGANDTRAQTELVLENYNYTRVADAGNQYGLINNQIQAGFNVFSKVSITNLVSKVEGTDTVTSAYYLLRYMQTDELSIFNSDEITMQSPVIGKGEIFGGSVGNAKGGIDSVNVTESLSFFGTKFNSDIPSISFSAGVVDKVNYIACRINTDKLFTTTAMQDTVASAFANTYDPSISSTLYSVRFDITNYTNPNRQKQLIATRTLTSDLVIPANSQSANFTNSAVGSRIGDAAIGGVLANVGSVTVVPWVDVINNVSFFIRNNTANPITIPNGTVIKVRVIKI